MAADPSDRPVAIRETTLAAALTVFTRYAFDGTRMAMVAGRRRGRQHLPFPSKEVLGNAVYQRRKAQLLKYMRAELPADGDIRASFGAMWMALVRFASEHRDAFAFLEHQQHESYLDDGSLGISQTSPVPKSSPIAGDLGARNRLVRYVQVRDGRGRARRRAAATQTGRTCHRLG